MKKPLKAFVLAAGFGTRLRPLTNDCPKVLLPFFGVPLLYILLEQIAQLEVEEIFVNGHYLSDQIENAIRKYPLKCEVHFCEEPQILGTAGAIGAQRKRLANCDLLVVNGDIITDFNLNDLVNKHRKSSALATMGLLKNAHPSKTVVWVDENHILSFGGQAPSSHAKEHSFACAQVLSQEFINEIPSGPSDIIPIYKKLIPSKKVYFHASDPFWADIGSPRDYFDAHVKGLEFFDKDKILANLHLPKSWGKLWLKK